MEGGVGLPGQEGHETRRWLAGRVRHAAERVHRVNGLQERKRHSQTHFEGQKYVCMHVLLFHPPDLQGLAIFRDSIEACCRSQSSGVLRKEQRFTQWDLSMTTLPTFFTLCIILHFLTFVWTSPGLDEATQGASYKSRLFPLRSQKSCHRSPI